jgi:hypothetical protein
LVFSENDKLNADGFTELVKLTRAKLVILATCDSITLGAMISRTTNVIAATSSVEVENVLSWEKGFFSGLAKQYTVSQAFDICRCVSGLPLVLLLKADLAFDIS